ncbi:MAG: HEPN domain-containing protein [Bacteroidota bacterium]
MQSFSYLAKETQATVNRAYYAVFHCLQALLQSEDVYSKTHQGTQRKFNELFIQTERFPKESAKMIANLSVLRGIADYDYQIVPSLEEANQAVSNANEFLNLVIEIFGQDE